MPRVPKPDTEATWRKEVDRRLRNLESLGTLGAAACRAGVTQWQDASGAVQIQVGLDPTDNVYEIKVGTGGTQLKLVATGANAGQILGLVISSIAGALSVGGLLSANGGLAVTGTESVSGLLSANGGISAPDHNGSQNVPTAPAGTKIFVQTSDPGGAANNGDVWINTT